MSIENILYYAAATFTLWINAAVCGAIWMGATALFSKFGPEKFTPDRQVFALWGVIGAIFGLAGSLYGLFISGFKLAFTAPYAASGVVLVLMLALSSLVMLLDFIARKLPIKGK